MTPVVPSAFELIVTIRRFCLMHGMPFPEVTLPKQEYEELVTMFDFDKESFTLKNTTHLKILDILVYKRDC